MPIQLPQEIENTFFKLTVLTAVTSGRLTTSGWLRGAVQMYNAAKPTRRSLNFNRPDVTAVTTVSFQI